MTLQTRINKLKKEIEDIKHTKYENWGKRTVMSVYLRILKYKLHNLEVDKKRNRYKNQK